jgi:transposase
MTRDQKIARARELRAEGIALHQISKILGVSKTTVLRWTDAEQAERDRKRSLAYKDANHDSVRAKDREYFRRNPGLCPRCSGSMSRRTERNGGICASCHQAISKERDRRLEALWLAGKSSREIAVEFGWTPERVSVEVWRLRAAGYRIPYRQRRAAGYKFPEQQVAA